MLEDKTSFISMATSHQMVMGYRAGWVAVIFKQRYGLWPDAADLKQATPSEPTSEFLGWLGESTKARNEIEGKRLILAEQAKLKALHKRGKPVKAKS